MAAVRWPIETVALEDLVLDPRNVRVRAGRGDGLGNSESAIAKYMAEAEDLLELVRDILRDGYLDIEIPLVVREDGHYVVLEGNRRATALKVIANPALLSASDALRVERMITRYPDHDSPTAIRVMISPSRADAQPLLARLHIGADKKGWIREQQAIFFHAQLGDGTTVDDLLQQYPAEASKIPKMIKLGEMREVIRGLRYDDPELRDFVMNSELKMSTFEYAYRPKLLQDALGLEFGKDGLLLTKHVNGLQRAALMYLLSRFKKKTLNTRSPELIAKYPAHAEFAEHLRRIVAGESDASNPAAGGPGANSADGSTAGETGGPSSNGGTAAGADDAGAGETSNGDSRGREPGSDLGQGSATSSHAGSQNGSRGPNRGETKSRLDMGGFEYRGTSAGMRRRLEELRRLDVRDYPNAAHDLLRTVLECAIKDYFRANGQPMQPKQTIGPCIEALAKAFHKNAKMTVLLNSINRKGRMNAEQYAGTTDSLSASNHEPDHFAEGPDVHAAWERIKPILIEIVGTKPDNP